MPDVKRAVAESTVVRRPAAVVRGEAAAASMAKILSKKNCGSVTFLQPANRLRYLSTSQFGQTGPVTRAAAVGNDGDAFRSAQVPWCRGSCGRHCGFCSYFQRWGQRDIIASRRRMRIIPPTLKVIGRRPAQSSSTATQVRCCRSRTRTRRATLLR
jgi:hypothetical protein